MEGAHWDQELCCWKLTDTSGRTYTSRFLITGIGLLSSPTLPNIPGVQDFRGDAFHTSKWPQESVSFEGKHVGIIGVGATAIQIIPEVAKTAKQLTVFQRTPNWAIPLHNSKIDKTEMDKIRKGYPELFKTIDSTRLGFMHKANTASIWDATPEEREAFWEELYAQPGFSFWVSNYKEILLDQKANDLVSEFIAKKIRQRVKDPWTADKLIPKTHGMYRLPYCWRRANGFRIRFAKITYGDFLLRSLQSIQRPTRGPDRNPDRAYHKRWNQDDQRGLQV